MYSGICACLAFGPADSKNIYQHIGLSGSGDDYAHLENKDAIQKTVIDEVQQKIKALAVTLNFSIRPVLIHCNSVSEAIEESGFFAKIINFSQFLTSSYKIYIRS